MTDAKGKARKHRLPKLTRIEKLTRGLLSARDINDIFTVKEIKGKGRGVFLRCAVLRKDSFVLEYEGDIISEAEAEIRERIYANNNEGCYIMSFTFQGAKMAIDATRRFDSIARLLNHSREPNIRFHPPFMIDLNGGLPRIASYALRDIYRGEEIVIDYGVRDVHISWLRNRQVGFMTNVDSDSSDGSNCASSDDNHTEFQTSERLTVPESYASCSSDATTSEGPTPRPASKHVPNHKNRNPDNMAFSQEEWAVCFKRLIPGGRLKSYIAGYESIGCPSKILKFIPVTSERKKQKSDSQSIVCLSTSSSSGSSITSVKSSALSGKNVLSKHSSDNTGRALNIELPPDEALDSIHKVLEWQKTSPLSKSTTSLPENAMNIRIVGVQSLSEFSHSKQDISGLSSSNRQQSASALQTQEVPVNPHLHHDNQSDTILHKNSLHRHSSSTSSSHLPIPACGNKDISVVTVDTSESEDTDESSSLSSFSINVVTAGKQPSQPECVAGGRVAAEPVDVCVVSDDECVPETPVSEKAPQNLETISVGEITSDDDDSSSSECEIVLTEFPKPSTEAEAGLTRNLTARRTVGFSSSSAQLQVAVIEPYVSPNVAEVPRREVAAITDTEMDQLRDIFQKYIANSPSKKKICQAINSNWDIFNVLIQRGVTLRQIRNTLTSFLKRNR